MTTVVNGFGELSGLFLGIQKEFETADFKRPLLEFTNTLRATHARGFAESRSPGGEPWREWYWRDPQASNNHKTLEVSSRLKQSVITRNADHVERVDRRYLEFGTSVEYAATHQDGAKVVTAIPLVGRRGGYLPAGTLITIPARPFVGMSEETVQVAVDGMADHAVAAILPEGN